MLTCFYYGKKRTGKRLFFHRDLIVKYIFLKKLILRRKLKILDKEAYLVTYQKSVVELFAKIINNFKPFTITVKSCIIDV